MVAIAVGPPPPPDSAKSDSAPDKSTRCGACLAPRRLPSMPSSAALSPWLPQAPRLARLDRRRFISSRMSANFACSVGVPPPPEQALAMGFDMDSCAVRGGPIRSSFAECAGDPHTGVAAWTASLPASALGFGSEGALVLELPACDGSCGGGGVAAAAGTRVAGIGPKPTLPFRTPPGSCILDLAVGACDAGGESMISPGRMASLVQAAPAEGTAPAPLSPGCCALCGGCDLSSCL
mmetsp:Transcript_87480/g.248061  ORF Transcript_87480/g.248061 Transcript_87480/m.248061 type:complete len:236 (+) Transcript_87480:298-1005(+)